MLFFLTNVKCVLDQINLKKKDMNAVISSILPKKMRERENSVIHHPSVDMQA